MTWALLTTREKLSPLEVADDAALAQPNLVRATRIRREGLTRATPAASSSRACEDAMPSTSTDSPASNGPRDA